MSRKNRILGLLAAVALLAVGVLDQTNPAMAPHYKDLRIEVADLSAFSQRIEARVAPGCSVFQLPIATFPNNMRTHDMESYAHLRPYLVSSSLRWSYGAFSGTSLADWQLALPQESTPALLDDLVAAGFCAVEVDRLGFADRAVTLEADLRSLLGHPISSTNDGRLVAWDLAPQRASLTARLGAEQIKEVGELVLHPVVVYTDRGAYDVAHDSKAPYQWFGPSPQIDVHNFGRTTTNNVRLTFSLAAPDSSPRRFTIRLPNGSTQVLDVDGSSPGQVQLVLDAVPGRNAVSIATEGHAVSINAAGPINAVDRKMVFGKLIDLRASVADPNIRLGVVQQRVE